MDFARAEPITEALVAAVRRGALGYPPHSEELGATFASSRRHWGWEVPAEASVATGGVVSGMRLALEVLCPPGPVVVPMPCYPPFRHVVEVTGRKIVPIELDPDADEIRGPLVLPSLDPAGPTFTPYLSVDERGIAVTSASKAFSMPATHGAQLVVLDPAEAALAHGVRLAPGQDYQPGLTGHVRLNLATSPERPERIVEGLAAASTQ